MTDERMPTALWVDAHLRRLNAEGTPYYVLNRGAYAAGTVLVKLNGAGAGYSLLIQQRDLDGVLGWAHALDREIAEEKQIDDYISRATARDPDLWVIEVEDKSLQNPFEGKII